MPRRCEAGVQRCKGDCKEAYQTAKDACLNRDHDCVEGCRAGRVRVHHQHKLDEDLAKCREDLRDAKTDCRANGPEEPEKLDPCIDSAQVTAFLCRRTRAEQAVYKRAAPASAPAPTRARPDRARDDEPQCRLDAKDAYLDCKAAPRGHQAQKDLCLNRDHACVEGCRAGRDSCREDPENELDADIARCNAARRGEPRSHRHPRGSWNGADRNRLPVAAFQCRDQARERSAARASRPSGRRLPGSCAEACPPAS